MYEQLYSYFTGEIHSGRLREGEKLPSKRALCQHLGVSGSTVETAYGLLCAEGYVLAKPKSGYYVCRYIPLAAGSGVGVRPAAERRESGVYGSFSTGAVDTSTFPYSSWAKLNRAVVYGHPELLQKGNGMGEYSLRNELSTFLRQYRGVRCSPEQVVIGAGMEYLSDMLVKLLPDNSVYALEDPGYNGIRRVLETNGRTVCYVPVDKEGMVVDALSDSGADIAYVTPSHQFPMGMTMPAGRRSRLLAWAFEKKGRYIIEDDYDSEFRYASRPIPAMQGLDSVGTVIYTGTFSRSIAPSIRAAYMVLPEELLGRYDSLFGGASSTVSRYEQEVLARFISGGYYSRYLRKIGNIYRKRCEFLTESFEKIPSIHIAGNSGGIHFLLWSEKRTESELLSSAAHEGIALRGISEFCRASDPPLPAIVMGFGGADEEFAKNAVERLAKVWS